MLKSYCVFVGRFSHLSYLLFFLTSFLPASKKINESEGLYFKRKEEKKVESWVTIADLQAVLRLFHLREGQE